jgi:hypothetical protein
VTSNLVFSSDGRRVFALSAGGDLQSAEVPRSGSGRAEAVRTERPASAGAVIAAGWLEGRLATIAVVDGDLEVSHGDYGIDSGPSEPCRAPLAGSGLKLTPGRRLDPYVRWWQEVIREEGLLGAITLVRDDDDRLHALFAWRDGCRKVGLVGERVTALIPFDEERHAAFVGRGAPLRPHGGWWVRWRARVHAASHVRPMAIHRLDRRGQFALLGRKLPGDGSFRAFAVQAPSGASGLTWDDVGLWAVEQRAGVWAIATLGESVDVVVPPGREVVGVVGHGVAGAPALVLREADGSTLSLFNERGHRTCVRAQARLGAVAVSPVDPVIAYLAGNELAFARIDET